ncbi:MAG TPA: hypothetical protein VNJ01_16955 [Bacteriovoracaceae bacterium]|nr:hypothetical protein [Bacteriovoracaceae bacterium]
MDEIEFLVQETFKHLDENYTHTEDSELPLVFHEKQRKDENAELPASAGLIYHIQRTPSIFVIRTKVSQNIREDYSRILKDPKSYPELRLFDNEEPFAPKNLRFFPLENPLHAEIIHDQLNNRRFPIHEERMCNLSDPGFSWWLKKNENGFNISFTMSIGLTDEAVKLGPLGDKELAIRNFQLLESLTSAAGLAMNIQNEVNRVRFSDCEQFLAEELNDLFEYGVINDTLKKLFRVLAQNAKDLAQVQSTWFYLEELAAMRRFWIQIQYNLNS